MTNAPAADASGTRPYTINGQYIKDMSFENPKAPASLFGVKDKPNIDLSVDLKSQQVQDTAYEVTITITAKASAGDMVMFLADLSYAGIISVQGEPEKDVLQELLLVECPTVLFPFARRIISDMTRDGGFPPLMLEPIDFMALYKARQKQTDEAQAPASAAVN